MGDKSRRAIRLRELMERGYSEEEAQKILIEQDIRAMASIAPIVAGGVQYGAARAMRAASDIDDIVRRHELGDEADPSFSDTDMEIAETLNEDAPRKPFTDEVDGGIMEEKIIDTPDGVQNQGNYPSVPSYLEVSDGKVGGKVPVDDYAEIRTASIKNPDADSMTLGKYFSPTDSYIVRAGKDSSYFDLGTDWDIIQDKYQLTESDMFEYFNKPALDDAIAKGKTIRFSHNPLKFKGTHLASEWKYLKQQLNVTDADLFFEGGFWYVK